MKRTAALVELGGSHDCLLYSQVAFLHDAGYRVHLVVSEDMLPLVRAFDLVDEFHSLPVNGGEIGSLRTAWRLWRLTGRIGADLVVFNTAQGPVVRDFTLLPNRGRRLAGIIHNIHKFRDSTGQKIISRRIRNYLALMDYQVDNRDDDLPITLDWFYPILFPDYGRVDVDKPQGELWAVIPGQIDLKRRDYEGFLNSLAENGVPEGFRVILLGGFENDATRDRITELVEATGHSDRIQLFDGFVDNATFHSCLAAADVILPLLHPGTDRFHEYSKLQISGAYLLAFSYRVPMLMESFFREYTAFRDISIFYDLVELPDILARLAMDPSPIHEKAAILKSDDRFTFEFQRDRYLRVVEG